MPDSSASRPALVSLAVHELRTPANVVSGYIKMLLKGLGGTLTEPQREALRNADASCERIAEILADMSELARLESGRLSPVRQQVDLGVVLRQAENAVTSAGVAGSCRAVLPDAPLWVRADRVRLANALVALATMVGKHSDRADVVLQAAANEGLAVVTVSDAQSPALPSAALPLQALDEYMGGLGVSLPLARFIVGDAGGALGTPAGAVAGRAAAIVLPLASDDASS